MNKFIGVGRLTSDPDVKYTQSGKCVTKFTLAVDRRYQAKDGERAADFFPCVAWEKLAEICGEYLNKGTKVLVEGRLQIRSYENKNGQKVWVTEIILTDVEFMEKKSASKSQDSGQRTDMSGFGKDVFDDVEIPF